MQCIPSIQSHGATTKCFVSVVTAPWLSRSLVGRPTRHRKNFDHLSAISNNLGWTEERFQPPKSHQIVDGIHYQIKSSLFFSLFRTGQSSISRQETKNTISEIEEQELIRSNWRILAQNVPRISRRESSYPVWAPSHWRHWCQRRVSNEDKKDTIPFH